MGKEIYEAPSAVALELVPRRAITTSPPVSVSFTGIQEEEDI